MSMAAKSELNSKYLVEDAGKNRLVAKALAKDYNIDCYLVNEQWQSNPPRPLTYGLKPFRIWLRISRDIR
jgi:hypothetical protein